MPLLSIDIAANYAKFQDAMTAIERTAKKSASGISSAFQGVNGALAGIGVTLSAGALAALVKSSIDAADHLNDLSKVTGVAVESLGGVGFAAEQAGSNLDGAAKALGKLNLAIASADTGGKDASEAFRIMGLSVRDANGHLKTADQMLVEVAGKFEKYRGGPHEAALANALFKKSYQDILPLLKDGGKALEENLAYYNRFSKVSASLAKDADEFNDQMVKIGLLSKAAGNQIASELLPTMSQIAAKMIAAKESADGFSGAAKTIGTAFKGITIAGAGAVAIVGQLGDHLGALAAVQGRIADLDFKGAANVFKDYGDESKKRLADYLKFVDQVTSGAVADTGPGPSKSGASGDWEDAPALKGDNASKLASRALADHLQAFERDSERERQILSSRNDMLQEYYKEDMLSIENYYSAKDAAAKEALQAQQANIGKEIALLQKATPKDDAIAAAENKSKIKELRDKSAQLEAEYNSQTTKAIIERAASMKDFGQQIGEVNTQFLEMQGRFEKVAGLRFDTEHAAASNRLTTQRQAAVEAGDTDKVAEIDQAKQQLNLMRAAATAQGRINELLIEESRIQTDLQVATERADMAAENGSISQIEALKRISDARRQAGADLQAVAQAFADAAAASPDAKLEEQAKRFKVAADKVVASADLVRAKMEGVFEHGFDSFFDKLLSGTASIKDAFKSLFSEIASDLSKIAIKDLGKDLFANKGPLGGVVDFTAGLFGGKSDSAAATAAKVAGTVSDAGVASTAATAAATQIATMGTAATSAGAVIGTLATTAVPSLTVAADAAAAALARVASTGSGSNASGLFGLFGGGTVGSSADYANYDWLASAKGNIISAGNLIPFANGGVPSSIVDAPTFFAMSGGRTGLMGEAGPEAIMPLHRDKHGDLAVKMLAANGGDYLLPLARDGSGKLSVRERLQKFADGGVFSTNAATALMPRIQRTFSLQHAAALAVPIGGHEGPTNTTNVSVNVPQSTSQESAAQIGARTAAAVARANRRNN